MISTSIVFAMMSCLVIPLFFSMYVAIVYYLDRRTKRRPPLDTYRLMKARKAARSKLLTDEDMVKINTVFRRDFYN